MRWISEVHREVLQLYLRSHIGKEVHRQWFIHLLVNYQYNNFIDDIWYNAFPLKVLYNDKTSNHGKWTQRTVHTMLILSASFLKEKPRHYSWIEVASV